MNKNNLNLNNKTFLNFVFGLIVLVFSMSSVYSADVYSFYNPVFTTTDIPSDIYVSGYACNNADCSSVDYSSKVQLHNGNTIEACAVTYNENQNYNQLLTCLDNSAIGSDYYSISSDDLISVKLDSNKQFGYLMYFSASDDEYFVKYAKQDNIVCNYDVCKDNYYTNLEFVKGNSAIAEVGELNIVNTENSLKPVQVSVPVQISETVCSAYRLTNSDWWKPTIPSGYSDFSAQTDIKLTIKNDDSNVEYFSERVTLSILADECASLTAFEWTPSTNLENARVEFKVETEVVDSQIVSSQKDYAYAYETIYPKELESACYARIEDFMLSNDNSFDLSSEVTQIVVGEDLFANFKTGAYRDESVTPMNFDYGIYFDDSLVVSRTNLVSESSLKAFNEDLSSYISNLGAGTHSVKVVVDPNGENCDISNNVTQIQNLIISEPETFDVTFRVLGADSSELVGAEVVFDSISLVTGDDGEVTFSEVLFGNYDYIVSYDGYESKFGSIDVGSDVSITITLSEENSKPVVSIPDVSDYYKNLIEIDVENYVVDYNEEFSELDIDFTKNSGDSGFSYNNGILTLTSSNKVGVSEFEVIVTDSLGASSTDLFIVNFTDNSNPVIALFSADENSGELEFTTFFNVEVTDVDNTDLVCSIDFGDFTVESGDCSDLDRISHTFDETGTFEVVLTVTDGVNAPITSELEIYVYEVVYRPFITSFDMSSSNGNIIPTDLTFSYEVGHENSNEEIVCSLVVNSVINLVDCLGDFSINDFNVEGDSIFELVVTDESGFSVTETIIETFESEPVVVEYKPFITSFDLTSSNGIYVPTDLTFDYVVGHENVSEDIVCEIKVNSNVHVVPCSSNFELENYIKVGEGTFTLTVRDESGDEVSSIIKKSFENEVVVVDYKPFITSFDLTSSNDEFVSTDLTFDYVVGHENSSMDIVCELFVNSESSIVDCDQGTFNYNNYNIVGTGTFRLVVSDLNNNEVTSIILKDFEQEVIIIDYKPFITSFDMNSSNGDALATDLSFSWVVGHENNEEIVCSLIVNSVSNVVDCDGNFTIDNYNREGKGIFELVVTDLDGDKVNSFAVETFSNYKPIISNFGYTSTNGNFVKTDLTFSWDATHGNNEDITCELIINSVSNNVSCSGTLEIIDYSRVGIGTFELIVRDESGNVVSSEISDLFELYVDLSELDIDLIVESDLELFEFDFAIEITNEELAKRVVSLKPELVCNNFAGTLSTSSNGAMASGIYSEVNGVYVFNFDLDTRDFNINIGAGEYCTFNVKLMDEFGGEVVVSENVRFFKQAEQVKITSIRGNGLDIMNYMGAALLGSVDRGYNSIEFSAVNNEAVSKQIEITVISADLGISFSDSIGLKKGQSKSIEIPLFVKSDVESGMYPVRYSVNVGEEKFTRYSYIRID